MVQLIDEDMVTEVVSIERFSYWLCCELRTLQAPPDTTSQMALNRKRAQFKNWSKFAKVLKSKKA